MQGVFQGMNIDGVCNDIHKREEMKILRYEANYDLLTKGKHIKMVDKKPEKSFTNSQMNSNSIITRTRENSSDGLT